MIVDTSALLAVLFAESDADEYVSAIADAETCRMSVANYLETSIVLESRSSAEAGYELDLFVAKAPIELVAVTAVHVQVARRAWRRFGKGNHAAGLNFGDCFAYALSDVTREPLLFKGTDFTLTDVRAA